MNSHHTFGIPEDSPVIVVLQVDAQQPVPIYDSKQAIAMYRLRWQFPPSFHNPTTLQPIITSPILRWQASSCCVQVDGSLLLFCNPATLNFYHIIWPLTCKIAKQHLETHLSDPSWTPKTMVSKMGTFSIWTIKKKLVFSPSVKIIPEEEIIGRHSVAAWHDLVNNFCEVKATNPNPRHQLQLL